MSSKASKRLVPELRFPEFRDAPEWQEKPLEDLISTITPPKKIPTTDYLVEGLFPIVDQGQSDIAGWTNDPDALIKNDLPLVVFGDHTCALKLLNQPFAQGADGIKVIKGKQAVNTEYLYQFLCFRPVVTEEYKRHFSILKTRVVAYPDKPSGEQQKIAASLSSLDDLITAQAKKIEALKAHKKGLMQQLFPAEGETVPRLRFPEFRDSPAWKKKSLSSYIQLVSGLHLSPTEYGKTGDIPYFTGPSDFTNDGLSASKWTNRGANSAIENDTLITVKGSGVGELWNLTLPCVAIGRQLMAIRAERCSGQFVYQILTTRSARFKALASGNLIPGLSRGDILGMNFDFPSHPEQQKIAVFLSSIDKLITAQTQKLETLKAHKKGLMQGLFPTIKEAEA